MLQRPQPRCLHVPLHSPTISRYCYRDIRRVDLAAFHSDIQQSPLYDFHSATSVDGYVELFNSEVERILDKHAPLKSRTRRVGRHDCSWLSANARDVKRRCRRRERRYRKTHSSAAKLAFQAVQRVTQLETPSRGPGPTPSGSVLTTSAATQRLPGERCATCCTETIDQSTVTVSVTCYRAASVSTSLTSWNAFNSRSPPAFSSSQNLTTAAAGTRARRCPSCRRPLPTRYARY